MAEIQPSFQSFVKLERVLVEGQTRTAEDRPRPTKQLVSAAKCNNKSQTTTTKSIHLPRGLIGSRCTGQVDIAGQSFRCLLETGSQVTTIPISIYNQHFSHQPVKSLCDLLLVEGAAGQEVPYLGYIEVTLTFPKEFIGAVLDVFTLALVVPDIGPGSHSQILIGMNTLEPLYDTHLETECACYQPSLNGYKAVLQLLQLRHQQAQGSSQDVRLASKTPVQIPAGRTVVIEGFIRANPPLVSKCALIEPAADILPGGLFVTSCLIRLPSHSPHKIPIIISNHSEQNITLSPLSIIAELIMSPQIMLQNVSITPQPNSKVNFKIDFGDSPVPPEWKTRIQSKLEDIPEVFSHHDLDFGCTNQGKHHIRLHDESPFKHRARPIHPQDIEAVRSHLRDLLETGVIRESESPFSSPIVVVQKKNGDYRKLNLQTIKDAYAQRRVLFSSDRLTMVQCSRLKVWILSNRNGRRR